jgi:hypothetical protein
MRCSSSSSIFPGKSAREDQKWDDARPWRDAIDSYVKIPRISVSADPKIDPTTPDENSGGKQQRDQTREDALDADHLVSQPLDP